MTLTVTELDLLEAWIASRGSPPTERVVELLSRTLSGDAHTDVSIWPVARRNAALLDLRVALWGRELEGLVGCTACGADIEFTLDLGAAVAEADEVPAEVLVETDDGAVRVRLPTDADLAMVAGIADPGEARRALARRCLLAPTDGAVDDDVIEAMEARMAEVDRAGALALSLRCAECGHAWEEPIDMAGFVAEEIQAAARRVIADVHTLASAYGWSEQVVLSIPPARRRVYRDLLEG